MSYSSLKIFTILFFIFYFGTAIYLEPKPSDHVFPFFSWFLFSNPPTKITSLYTLRVLESGGEKLNSPVLLRDAQTFVYLKANAPTVLEAIIERLAKSIISSDGEKIAALRRELELYFLTKPTRYEIVLITYDLIEYWRESKVRKVDVLATFTTDNLR
ncbi:MAG: hypothetical protein HY001_03905 [Candidatus Portnoybacteria bacterium]|nr:hypothetical protein [Candidatus Portnoybacteria bacterium]